MTVNSRMDSEIGCATTPSLRCQLVASRAQGVSWTCLSWIKISRELRPQGDSGRERMLDWRAALAMRLKCMDMNKRALSPSDDSISVAKDTSIEARCTCRNEPSMLVTELTFKICVHVPGLKGGVFQSPLQLTHIQREHLQMIHHLRLELRDLNNLRRPASALRP